MINSLNISNFRCFRHLTLSYLTKINIFVGDNGRGKTSLFEAIFLTLSGNVEVSVRLRAQRGFEGGQFSGQMREIEEAIWRDYFNNLQWEKDIEISLFGDWKCNRSLTISRNTRQQSMQLAVNSDLQEASIQSPLSFTWTDSSQQSRTIRPRIAGNRLEFSSTDEDLGEFFHVAANQPTPSIEVASRFSVLSRFGRADRFIESGKKYFQ